VGAGAVFFGADLFAAAFFSGAVFFAAFAGTDFTAALLTAAFLVATGFGFAASARFAALAARAFARFATNAAFCALRSFRFGFDVAGAGGSAAFLEAAHLLRCASAIAFLPAALIFRRLRFVGSIVAAAIDGGGDDLGCEFCGHVSF
jgi:hypothetical protein